MEKTIISVIENFENAFGTKMQFIKFVNYETQEIEKIFKITIDNYNMKITKEKISISAYEQIKKSIGYKG